MMHGALQHLSPGHATHCIAATLLLASKRVQEKSAGCCRRRRMGIGWAEARARGAFNDATRACGRAA